MTFTRITEMISSAGKQKELRSEELTLPIERASLLDFTSRACTITRVCQGAHDRITHVMHTAPPPLPVRPSRQTHKVRIGQKCVLYAILIYFVILGLGGLPKTQVAAPLLGVLIGLLGLTSLVLGIIGILRIGDGLRYGLTLRIVLVLLTIIPLVNLVTLLVLNAKATSMLRAAGYKVGLLGAKSSRA